MAKPGWFGRVFKKNPPTAMKYYKSGMRKAEAGNAEGAIEDYTNAINFASANDEERAMALFNRAAVYHSLHRNEEALRDLDEVLKIPGVPKRILLAAESKRERVLRRTGQA